MKDLLLDTVLINSEIVSRKRSNRPALAIDNANIQLHQVRIYLQDFVRNLGASGQSH